jgi:hypothetical protein
MTIGGGATGDWLPGTSFDHHQEKFVILVFRTIVFNRYVLA